MAVPKRRTSRAKRDSRRAQHDRFAAPTLDACQSCGAVKLRHRVCPECGFYRGRQILDVGPTADAAEEASTTA